MAPTGSIGPEVGQKVEEQEFWGLGVACMVIAFMVAGFSKSIPAFIVFLLMLVAVILFSASKKIEHLQKKMQELAQQELKPE